MNKKVLCVDDDANILAGFQRNLRKQFSLDIAVGPEAGLKAIEANGPYAVVVADMQMPGMNGIQFLTKVEQRAPDTVRVMLTGNADQKTAMDAVNEGHVFRFLNKPCDPESLAATLQAALRQYQLITAERDLLERTLSGSVRLLTDTLSMTDPVAFGRARQLRDAMRGFARHFNITQTWDLELAAMLAPIGYLAMPASVLQRSREGMILTGPEKDMFARAPETGANLLANIPRLETVASIVRYQQKNFDGSGHPADAVAGEDIPIGARILKVLNDLFIVEAKKVPRFKALESLRHCAGRYDPKVLEAVAASFDLTLSSDADETTAPRCVTLNELQIAHRLAAGIRTRDGTLIVPAGITITQMHLERLRNFAELSGIQEPLYVNHPEVGQIAA